ncbi:hypothetical protein [Clostridium sp. B9]|uniref:hypothetical protein n=1 Tax=Clostridium sp. B9 TaxID=3423224 RepID=UPI003D2F08B2
MKDVVTFISLIVSLCLLNAFIAPISKFLVESNIIRFGNESLSYFSKVYSVGQTITLISIIMFIGICAYFWKFKACDK